MNIAHGGKYTMVSPLKELLRGASRLVFLGSDVYLRCRRFKEGSSETCAADFEKYLIRTRGAPLLAAGEKLLLRVGTREILLLTHLVEVTS